MNRRTFSPSSWAVRLLGAAGLAGCLLLVAGFIVSPKHTGASVLLVSFYVLGLGLGGLLFIALQYVTAAGWSVVIRRVPEAMTAALPLAALGLAVVFLAAPGLYSWVEASGNQEAGAAFKASWLNWPFFLARSAVYVLAWSAFAAAIVRTSRRQDCNADIALTRRNIGLSAAFLVVFGVTFWLASYDWIMSLEPQWYSTVFGVYNFAGAFLSSLAAIIIVVIWLQQHGPFRRLVTADHLHDLGKLLFGFSTFWMYIWFCQYMLIWYVNNPEETGYFVKRLEGGWQSLFWTNLALNWAVPFVVLLPRWTKRDSGVLVKVSAVVLLGRWLDLYLMIFPAFSSAPIVGVWEIGALAAAGGLFVFILFRSMSKTLLVPINDPYLTESLCRGSESDAAESPTSPRWQGLQTDLAGEMFLSSSDSITDPGVYGNSRAKNEGAGR